MAGGDLNDDSLWRFCHSHIWLLAWDDSKAGLNVGLTTGVLAYRLSTWLGHLTIWCLGSERECPSTEQLLHSVPIVQADQDAIQETKSSRAL